MEMKDVKEIIIPNPTYEVLEYVDIPAGCYLNFNDNGSSSLGYYIDANWNLDGDTVENAELPFGSMYYNGTNYYRYHLSTNANLNMQACSGRGTYTPLFNATLSARHIIELNYRFNNKAYCDNVDKGTFSPTSGTNTGVVYIGGRRYNNNGTITINDYPHTIRFYSAKSKSTSTNPDSIFYPVKRKSDGKVGILKVWNRGQTVRFCTTETSVECIAGPVVSTNINIPVKKITNANGDIIWGSQKAFPYRRLEYIHFNGNDWITTTYTPYNNFGFYLDICWDNGDINSWNGHGKNISNNRAFIGVDGNGKIQYGSGAASGTISGSDPYTRHKYQVNTSSSSAGKLFIDGTQVWSGNSNYQEANRGTMMVGGVWRSSGDYGPVKAKIYNVRFINTVSTATTFTWNWVPVQRKSDGAIGFLNLGPNNEVYTFYTSVNNLIEAGPVVEEYWDQTNPF